MVLAVETNRLAKDILGEGDRRRGREQRGCEADGLGYVERGRDRGKKRLCEFELVVVRESG
jgi:hypothetical protein